MNEVFTAGIGSAAAVGLAAGGYAYAAMWPASRLFGPALRAPRQPDDLALTFDDGPNPRWTPLLLDLLAKYEVRASFFLLGKYATSQAALVRRMHGAGHLIGNHSWAHPNLALTSTRKTREELSRTSDELAQMLGEPVRYFRPPFGARRPATLRIAGELGLIPVLWNAIASDWTATSPALVTARMTAIIGRNRQRGFATNLVLHDGGQAGLEVDRSASVAAAGELIEIFKASRRFVRLDEWSDFM